jgi:uncharacterized protein (TIGR03437 family)
MFRKLFSTDSTGALRIFFLMMLVICPTRLLATNCTLISRASQPQSYLFTGAAQSASWDFLVDPPDCSWIVASSGAFATLTSPVSGTGNGQLRYSITSNTGSFRNATFTISSGSASTTHTGSQNSSACSFQMSAPSPSSGPVPAQGATYSISVTSNPADCRWIPQAAVPWISGLPDVASSGAFIYTVAANSGPPRQTALTLAGAFTSPSVTVTQIGNGSPLMITVGSPLPDGTVGVNYSQTLTASGGSAPYRYSISAGAAPDGLILSSNGVLSGTPKSAGTFQFSVLLTDSQNFSSAQAFRITVVSAGVSLLQLSPSRISLSAFAGGASDLPQVILVVSRVSGAVDFEISADAGTTNTPAPSWLKVAAVSGTTPATILVSADHTGLVPGIYSARLHVTIPSAPAEAPIDIPVTLTVAAAPPRLDVSVNSLSFTSRFGAEETLSQSLAASNAGGGGAFSITTVVAGNSPWVTVSPAKGQVAADTPLLIEVNVNTRGLSVGSYHDLVRVTSPSNSIDVPLTLFISNHGPILSLNVNGLRFLARQGNGSSQPKSVRVLNLGELGSTVNWKAELLSGSDFLDVGSTTGTASVGTFGTVPLSLSPRIADLPAGPRYALLRISDPQAVNSPVYASIVLDLQPATELSVPDPSPSSLFFSTASGSPPAQNVTVFASTKSPEAFQVSAATSDGRQWLLATIVTATASTLTPGVVRVSINSAGLPPGVYTGGVNISLDGSVRTVNVTLVVPSVSPSVNTAVAELVPAAVACLPTRLAIAQTGLTNNFSIPAGWPATLSVQLLDDCANTVLGGSIVATFSNGDPPLTLKGDRTTNVYSATWQPRIAMPQTTITIRASAGTLRTAVALFNGGVNENNNPPPSFAPGGLLHLYFDSATAAVVGSGLAPGGLMQVYGARLAPALNSPGVVPLLNEVSGTFMLIGNFQAPLFYVSDSPLVAQIPFELPPDQQYSVVVSANGALSVPQAIDVVPVQPGVAIFPYGTNNALVQHFPSFDLVTPANPARPGEQLVVYLAGMGLTNPVVKSGEPTPLQQVPARFQPTVTVDNQRADFLYAGLTPTGIGLYQINFSVPRNAKNGLLELVVTQDGVRSNTTKLPVSTEAF